MQSEERKVGKTRMNRKGKRVCVIAVPAQVRSVRGRCGACSQQGLVSGCTSRVPLRWVRAYALQPRRRHCAVDPLSVTPRSWVVDAAANEMTALHHLDSYLRYRMHVVDEKGDQTRDVIESKDGTVARLILRNGRPLTEEQDKAERQRLNDMLASSDRPTPGTSRMMPPSRKIADSLIRLMPDAMINTYMPGQPQTGKNPGRTEIVLDYKPNPKFHPPTTHR